MTFLTKEAILAEVEKSKQDPNGVLHKWANVLTEESEVPFSNKQKLYSTAQLLENESKALVESAQNTTAGIQNYDPVLIKMVRRASPVLIAHDIVGFQAMNMPTGLVFAMKTRYGGSNVANPEALFNEANTAYSGKGTQAGTDPFGVNPFTNGTGMTTAEAESQTAWAELGITIEKVPVTAKARQLKASYSIELAQDLKAVHGLDADAELTNILSNELIAETNREIVRTVYIVAKQGAQWAETPGTFDMAVDSDGRWFVERVKGLAFAIEREANAISLDTRRGKGNIIITSADVASALQMAGVLDYAPALAAMVQMNVDVTGIAYAGNFGKYKIYVDPYLSANGVVVGYKGAHQYDAGIFYSPYVVGTMFQAQDPVTFQPILGIKSRYDIVANPLSGSLAAGQNAYYRKFAITNLL